MAFIAIAGKAIRLDGALCSLHGRDLRDDAMESGWRDVVERRITVCGMLRTMLYDGVLDMGMVLGPGIRPRI